MTTRFRPIRLSPLFGGLLLGTVLIAAARTDDFQALDDPAQLDELAASVQASANSLCWELHRYHRDQAEFADAYRQGKEVWSMAGALRDALRSGNIDPANLNNQVLRMNESLARVEKATAKWGDGTRPGLTTPPVEERSVVVTPSPVDFEIPLLFGGGIRVGGRPRAMVVEPATPALPRKRFHPNARGSKRSLERELANVRTLMNYLLEDTGASPDTPAQASSKPAAPIPIPPEASSDPALAPAQKITPPPSAKK